MCLHFPQCPSLTALLWYVADVIILKLFNNVNSLPSSWKVWLAWPCTWTRWNNQSVMLHTLVRARFNLLSCAHILLLEVVGFRNIIYMQNNCLKTERSVHSSFPISCMVKRQCHIRDTRSLGVYFAWSVLTTCWTSLYTWNALKSVCMFH